MQSLYLYRYKQLELQKNFPAQVAYLALEILRGQQWGSALELI